MPDAVVVLSTARPLRGMERAALGVVAALRADGLAVDVVELEPAPPGGWPPGPRALPRRLLRLVASSRRGRALVRAPGPPLVLVGMWTGLRVLPWRRPGDRAVVAWEHSLTTERRAALRGFDAVARVALPLVRRRAGAVVAVSAAVAAALADAEPALAGRTTTVPNPVDVALRSTAAPPARAPRAVDGAQLLVIGGLEPLKNPELALRALALLPGAHLHVAGDGPRRARLQRLAHRLGVAGRTTWHGHTDAVPALLARADALVHPSRSETFGYALLEAAAAGVPVVAAPTAQARHLVPAQVPGAVAGAGPAALAAAVAGVLAHPPAAGDVAAAAAARAAALDPAALVAAWRRVLGLSLR